MTILQARFLREQAYQTVSLTHFFVDVLNSSRTVIVALLALSLGLTNAQVGIALLFYNIGSALTQPLFGVGADRYGSRWFVVGGMIWMVSFYTLAAIAGGWLALGAITLASLGSGSVHPAGTKVASESSVDAQTQATGVFFASGQTGLFIGPIVAGAVISLWGRPGYLVLPLLALTAVASGLRWIGAKKRLRPLDSLEEEVAKPETAKQQVPWRTVIPLIIIIITSSTIGIATINFAPKLFAEMGYSALYVGLSAGLFMLGSAVGGIVGGTMADRLGRRPPILLGMFGTILPLLFYIPAEDPWRFILLTIAGFFAGMPHSILVIAAQALMPGRRAFASGLILGLMFFSGAVGAYLLGIIADEIGLATALQALIILPIFAIIATLLLPREKAKPEDISPAYTSD